MDRQTFRLVRLKTSRTGAPPQNFLRRLVGPAAAPVTTVLQDLWHTFDATGNIVHIRDDAQQAIYFNGQVVLPQFDYTYDALYRLTDAGGREHIGQAAQPQSSWDDGFRINLPQPGDGQAMRNYTEQYRYDAVGNFTQQIHQAANGNWTRSYAFNEASAIESGKSGNHLTGTTVGATSEAYAYDGHGNTIAMPHLTQMQWDFRDRLSVSARQAVNPSPPPDKVAESIGLRL